MVESKGTKPTPAEISKVMSYLGKKTSHFKKGVMKRNGKSRRKHFHIFDDGIKCTLCKKYLSQFNGRDPNGGFVPPKN